jgi:hypothetical protein
MASSTEEGVEHVDGAHDGGVGEAARVAGQDADGAADDEGQQHRRDAHEQRQPPAQHQAREQVAAQLVGAQQVAGGADGLQALEHRGGIGIAGHHPGCGDGGHDQQQQDAGGDHGTGLRTRRAATLAQ